jgi:hypothetical protein
MVVSVQQRANERQRPDEADEDWVSDRRREGDPVPPGFDRETLDQLGRLPFLDLCYRVASILEGLPS